MYFYVMTKSIISLSNAIFSELIGKLPIITVNISLKNVSHNSQYICNCYLDM